MFKSAALFLFFFQSFLGAQDQIVFWEKILDKTNTDVVKELLTDDASIKKWEHYPQGDIFDFQTRSQYYYHSHREGEYGHFHTFIYQLGLLDEAPVWDGSVEEKDYLHIIGVSTDSQEGLLDYL